MKLTIDFNQFEPLTQASENQFIGGFSSSYNHTIVSNYNEQSNNCLGGNCKYGCGVGQNIQCNTAAGCK